MTEQELFRLLLALTILLASSLIVGNVLSSLGLPRVIGEIFAGLLLGPSLLGYIFPDIYIWIFAYSEHQQIMLSVFYWMGLILLMFSAGFNIQLDFPKKDQLLIIFIVLGGTVLPLIAGFIFSRLIDNSRSADPLAFSLVFAIATAVTSIPVLSKIFADLGVLSGRFARLVLGAAAIQDFLLWILLSFALNQQQNLHTDSTSNENTIIIVIATVTFTIISIRYLPVALITLYRMPLFGSTVVSIAGYSALVCLVIVTIASFFGVNVIYGALVAGIVIGQIKNPHLEKVKDNIATIAIWVFVPIYFSLVGLRMDIPNNINIPLIVGFFIFSSIVKVVSVCLMVRSRGLTWTSAINFGITMNARGGPGIVLASVSYAAGIVDQAIFVTFVITSIITSLLAGVWLKRKKTLPEVKSF